MDHPAAEHRVSLWRMVGAPIIWALHFLASYATSAVVCARHSAAPTAPQPGLQLLLAIYTAVAMLAIALQARHSLRLRGHGRAADDSNEGRHRFLSQVGLLLAGLSLIATLYVAVAAIYIGVGVGVGVCR